MVYSQLVRYAHGPEQKSPADFTIVPDLAEKWEYQSPTVIVFTLRKGVHFHNKPPVNGREVTAEDAKYSIQRFMTKSAFRARFDVVQSIDVVDRYTLRVTLKEPFAPFLNHLAAAMYVAILPREVEEKFKDFNRPEAMIGSGPFMLKSYQKGVQIVFERNPDYFVKGLPYLDGVVIEITPDASARLSLLRAGKVELPHMWGYLSAGGGQVAQADEPGDGLDAHHEPRPAPSSTSAPTSRRSTTSACGGPSRSRSTGRHGTTRSSTARAASTRVRCRAR